LITLPIVGPGAWIAWVEQLGRAADPNWVATGIGFNRFLPPLVVSALAVGSVAAVVLVPRPIAGYWVGLLMVLGAASLRIFTVLFMLPALLRIRIEPALVAVTLISLYGGQPAALWLGIALVAIAYVVWPRPSIADDEHLRSEQVARTLA
jgi:hypothetical protein